MLPKSGRVVRHVTALTPRGQSSANMYTHVVINRINLNSHQDSNWVQVSREFCVLGQT